MMIVPAGVKVHLALGYTDMRNGLDGLAMLVQQTLWRVWHNAIRRRNRLSDCRCFAYVAVCRIQPVAAAVRRSEGYSHLSSTSGSLAAISISRQIERKCSELPDVE
jgi:hypothetical protein